ncbi:MAG: winged helix-turn-helix domain-containing protein [Gemmataceae bacterium]
MSIGRGKTDVHLKLSQFSQAMNAGLSPLAADLLELAAYVYVADQAVTRGGTKSFDYGDRWHRDLRFTIPVRCPHTWNRSEVRESLRGLLHFLTDDDYEFEFVPASRAARLDRFLFDTVSPPDDGAVFDEVVLFSGGIDSLCGAVEEVLAGQHRVLLCSHRPENRVYSRQRELVSAIRSRLRNPKLAPHHFAATVNKGKKHNRGFTQRSRSFLFASLATVMARMFHLDRIRFYENGVTSLNLPISPQMIGGRASRTTHPQTLWRISRLFSLLFETPFTVENPFQWHTKPEILKRLGSLGHSDLCAGTSSCVNTWQRTEQHPHCGLCSQCVDRRVSVLAATIPTDHDPESRYESDVMIGERTGADLLFVERYVGSAYELERFSSVREFAAKFGEIAHVLPYTGMSADRAAQAIHDLYRRHATEVSHAIQTVIASRSGAVMKQSYPACSLLGAVVGRTARSRPVVIDPLIAPTATGPVENRLVIDSERFEVRRGVATCFLGATKEFQLIERLHRARAVFLSLDTLREDVWEDSHTEKNTIQRTVSNLRRKLRENGVAGVAIEGKQKGHYRLVASPS